MGNSEIADKKVYWNFEPKLMLTKCYCQTEVKKTYFKKMAMFYWYLMETEKAHFEWQAKKNIKLRVGFSWEPIKNRLKSVYETTSNGKKQWATNVLWSCKFDNGSRKHTIRISWT